MKVLIVDDEKVVAESTSEIFRIAGHEPFSATSAREALDIAREVQPEILLTDVVMPGETGIELAISIRRELPSCKILLISGQAETSNLLEDARRQGFEFEILAKPHWPPDLIKKAEELVYGRPNSEAASAV